MASLDDLSTAFVTYVEALRDAQPTKEDSDTLVAKDLPTVRGSVAGAANLDDANTMYAAYLT